MNGCLLARQNRKGACLCGGSLLYARACLEKNAGKKETMQRDRNFQKELEKILRGMEGQKKRKTLLLHSCCAPCSSYVLEYMANYFDITVFYYNPNISPKEEYDMRVRELKRLLGEMPLPSQVQFVEGAYEPARFSEIAKGLEGAPERGERCFRCYRLRLEAAAKYAAENHFGYFTTTLSLSPKKNARKLNQIGEYLAEMYHVPYLLSDFKKNNGFNRSIELSEKYGLYRQNYCGCVYSKRGIGERESF